MIASSSPASDPHPSAPASDEVVVLKVSPDQLTELRAGRCPTCRRHTVGRLPNRPWYCAECATEWSGRQPPHRTRSTPASTRLPRSRPL